MDFKHLVSFEQEIMSFPCYLTHFFYRIESPELLVIKRKDYSSTSGKLEWEQEMDVNISPNIQDEKTILKNFLIDLFSYRGSLYGNPWYESSEWFTEKEFNGCCDEGTKLRLEREDIFRKAGEQTPIIQFCETHQLNPEPEGSSPNNWYANCPSGGQHRIMVSTQSQTWGCGYCKKKGDLEDLKDFINHKI